MDEYNFNIDDFDISNYDLEDMAGYIGSLPYEEQADIIWESVKEMYNERPVDIKTFIYDPRYLGDIYGDILFPYWENLLLELYPSAFHSPYNEVILSCSVGSGKTSCASISIAYEIYKLMCMKNPATYYGLASHTTFTIALFSPKLGIAIPVLWQDNLCKVFDKSPYFKEKVSLNKSGFISKISSEGVKITNNITLHAGVESLSVQGKAIFGAIVDEANFSVSADDSKQQKNYFDLCERRGSRFLLPGNLVPGMMWLISQPVDENDFLNRRIEQVRENNKKECLIRDNIARWEVHGHKKDLYSGKTFDVFIGDQKRDPFIIEDESQITPDMEDLIIQVPVEHKQEFLDNIITSLRNIAGRRIQADIALFKSKKQLRDCFVAPCRFNKDIIEVSFTNPEDQIIKHVPDLSYFKKPHYPNCYRFIHLDIATDRDIFGMASVYSTVENICIHRDSTYVDAISNITKRERFYTIDFAVGIRAKKGEEISILKVLNFIFLLMRMGYPIKQVSTDMYQGKLTREILSVPGLETKHVSVDASKLPYLFLKDIINAGRLIGVKNEYLLEELINLREYEKKINHTTSSSKDLSDAVAAALYECGNSDITQNNVSHYQALIDHHESTNKLHNFGFNDQMKHTRTNKEWYIY